jgi:predicted permease
LFLAGTTSMSPVVSKFILSSVVIVVAMAGGYFCRRFQWVSERVGEKIMTFVGVFGYASVAFLSVWGTRWHAGDFLLPVLGSVHMVAMTFLSLALSGLVTNDRPEKALFAIAGGTGNNGFTMGAFVLYLLYGEPGMGLSNVYILLFMPVAVLVMFPLARHYASEQPSGSVWTLIRRSLWDWRSIGLPVALAGIGLSVLGVPRPPQVVSWYLLDILVYSITPLAFFGIGLRLHASKVWPMSRMLAGLAVVRFGLALLAGLALAGLTQFTPWPFAGLRWNVFVVQSFVPTAVTMVAIANMFNLRPNEASVLFVVNTVMYLVFVLPVVWLWLGR